MKEAGKEAVEPRALGYDLVAEIEPRVDLDSPEASAAFANLIAHLHSETKRQSLSELFLFVNVSCVPQPPWTASEEATYRRAMGCTCALFASLSTSVLQVTPHLPHAQPQTPRTYPPPYHPPPPAPTPHPIQTLYPQPQPNPNPYPYPHPYPTPTPPLPLTSPHLPSPPHRTSGRLVRHLL